MYGFTSISLSFVKRSANQYAHKLAQTSDIITDAMKWIIDPPSKSLIHDVFNL